MNGTLVLGSVHTEPLAIALAMQKMPLSFIAKFSLAKANSIANAQCERALTNESLLINDIIVVALIDHSAIQLSSRTVFTHKNIKIMCHNYLPDTEEHHKSPNWCCYLQ